MADGDPQPDPAAIRQREDRDELMRRACLSHLELADRGLATDEAHTAWCRDFVAQTPALQRPLSSAEQPHHQPARENAATASHRACAFSPDQEQPHA